MQKKYTQQDIDQFFDNFKELPNSFSIEQVHQLIDNPNAKAKHRVKYQSKLLKRIIMTSAFIIGVSALLLWLSPEEPVKADKTFKEKHAEHSPHINKRINRIPIIKKQTSTEKVSPEKELKKRPTIPPKTTKVEATKPDNETIGKKEAQQATKKFTPWPCDTLIDKESMFVRLTPEELLKIGIVVRDNRAHYHNITPDGNYDMQLTGMPEKYRITTHNDYYVWATSSLSCDEFTLGGPNFYSKIETLIPILVAITNNKTSIYWFTPKPSLFEDLPERYSHLKSTIKHLKHLKKTCPEKSFINYWSQDEAVFNKISTIELSKEELERIGFEISSEKVIISDQNDINRIELHDSSGVSTKGNSSKLAFPPNPFPMAITDTQGRRRYFTGIYANNKSVDRNYILNHINTLIPIEINLEKVIPPRKETLIFWFYPTDDFINSLPERIKHDLKSELDDINKGTKKAAKPCTYFEVCRSTLPIGDLRVYPNPANQDITIDFSLQELVKGRIALMNISGVQVKTVVPQRNFEAGRHSFQVSLSDVSSGVYLIAIVTERGFKTQRIMVSK